MNKFVLDNKKTCNVSFPLGGIGTGCIRLTENGLLSQIEANNRTKRICDAFSFFAVKAVGENSSVDARILTSGKAEKNGDNNSSSLSSLPNFEKSVFTNFFPFAEISFSDITFPAQIKMTSFNPFIPLNYTDSGIPAAFFEFEIKNVSDEKKDFTLCGVLENPFEKPLNTVGCTENGEAYLHMSGISPKNSICISTNGKNVSYRENLSKGKGNDSYADFWNSFTKYATFADSDLCENKGENSEGAIEVRFSLEKGESACVRFLISWYLYDICDFFGEAPCTEEETFQKSNFSEKRNYYAQYLENSIECASYCFRHWNRLKTETLKLTNGLWGSTVSPSVLQSITTSLCTLKSKSFVRTGDGMLYDLSCKVKNTAFALFYLFPELDKAKVYEQIKYFAEIFDDVQTLIENREEIFELIIRFFGYFRLYGNEDELIEGWYDVSRLLDSIFSASDNSENTSTGIRTTADFLGATTLAVLKSAVEISEIVKDKKRAKTYSALYSNASKLLGLSNKCDESFYRRQMQLQFFSENLGLGVPWSDENISLAVSKLQTDDQTLGFSDASLMIEYGRTKDGLALSDKIWEQNLCDHTTSPFAYDLSSYCLFNSLSGFKYNAYEKHIGFTPLSDYCPTEYNDTFKCFFSVADGYGYVEEGIDYIEINMLYGKLDIKSFCVPRTPRIVQYCGRNRKFTCSDLCVDLDTNLEISPEKKLTILIDIKPES